MFVSLISLIYIVGSDGYIGQKIDMDSDPCIFLCHYLEIMTHSSSSSSSSVPLFFLLKNNLLSEFYPKYTLILNIILNDLFKHSLWRIKRSAKPAKIDFLHQNQFLNIKLSRLRHFMADNLCYYNVMAKNAYLWTYPFLCQKQPIAKVSSSSIVPNKFRKCSRFRVKSYIGKLSFIFNSAYL